MKHALARPRDEPVAALPYEPLRPRHPVRAARPVRPRLPAAGPDLPGRLDARGPADQPRRGGGRMSAPRSRPLLAEFETPGALVRALRLARADGHRALDAYTPFPLEDLS